MRVHVRPLDALESRLVGGALLAHEQQIRMLLLLVGLDFALGFELAVAKRAVVAGILAFGGSCGPKKGMPFKNNFINSDVISTKKDVFFSGFLFGHLPQNSCFGNVKRRPRCSQ